MYIMSRLKALVKQSRASLPDVTTGTLHRCGGGGAGPIQS